LAKTVCKRLLLAVVQIFAVATIVFLILQIMPGDPAELMLEANGTIPDREVVDALRETMGLNKPVLEQYGDWLKNLFKMDFGLSYYNKVPVSTLVTQRMPNTLELAIVALLIASVIGIVVGIISSRHRGKYIDYILTSVTVIGVSIPSYVLGAVLVLLFALILGLLPASGFEKAYYDFGMHIKYLLLPATTLALGLAAAIARITRSSMLEEINRDYIQTLRAKGLKERLVIYKHALRNSLIPTITVIGLQLGSLIGGTVVIENIFSWPGLSTLMIQAVNHRDYPLIQGCVVVIASIYILINMIVDILYRVIDPKVR
jgi:peptide/nickel transport system permease protein